MKARVLIEPADAEVAGYSKLGAFHKGYDARDRLTLALVGYSAAKHVKVTSIPRLASLRIRGAVS